MENMDTSYSDIGKSPSDETASTFDSSAPNGTSFATGNASSRETVSTIASSPSYEIESPAIIANLQAASLAGDLTAVQVIFERQWLEKSSSERVPIHKLSNSLDAAQENHQLHVIRYLLSQGLRINMANVKAAVNVKSYTLLQLFLDFGWNINEPMDWGVPPPLAVTLEDFGLTKWFLLKGANPNAPSYEMDITPLSYAVLDGPFEIVQMLFYHGGSINCGELLQWAVRRDRKDYLEVLNFILDKGAPLNKIMYETRPQYYDIEKPFGVGTPLHVAAERGKLDVVMTLLDRGADPRIKDPRGLLAIERAELRNHTSVVDNLRSLSLPT